MIAAMIDGMIIGNALIDLGELFSSGYIAKYLSHTNNNVQDLILASCWASWQSIR